MKSKILKFIGIFYLLVIISDIFFNDMKDSVFAQENTISIPEDQKGLEEYLHTKTNDNHNTDKNIINNEEINNFENTKDISNSGDFDISDNSEEEIIGLIEKGIYIDKPKINSKIYTSEISKNDNKSDLQIQIINPKKNIKFSSGLININNIDSYNISGGDSTYCSMITRLNLSNILSNKNIKSVNGIGSGLEISIGNAVDLINQGILAKRLIPISGSFDNFSGKLWDMYYNSGNNVFDFYIYTNKYENEYKGHRFTVFIANNKKIYVLDPIRGIKKTKPQLMPEYINDINQKESNIYIYYYGFGNQNNRNNQIHISGEKLQLNLHNIIKSFEDGTIIPKYGLVGRIYEVEFTKDIEFWTKFDDKITIYSGTKIKEASGGVLDIYNLYFKELSNRYILSGHTNRNDFIYFGVSGQNMTLNQPVKIEIKTDLSKGANIKIKLQKIRKEEVSILKNKSNCNLQNISNNKNRIGFANNGTVEFYTCDTDMLILSSTSYINTGLGCDIYNNTLGYYNNIHIGCNKKIIYR